MAERSAGETLLDVRDLVVEFPHRDGRVAAADGVSFSVSHGEIVGLVGESGCGKSATALALFRLLPEPGRLASGHVFLEGIELTALPESAMRAYRGAGLAYVPQEPSTALNPVVRIGTQIVDVIRAHRDVSKADAWAEAVEVLTSVGIADPERRAREYAHQYSGGMKQRALIAMALAARPRVLIADEPTTALDVTTQAGILDLLAGLARGRGLGILLITHDLGVVASVCDRVLVMYAGRIVEEAPVDDLFRDPRHPYTRALLAALPRAGVPRGALAAIPGTVPNLARLPTGCAFHPRCPDAEAVCRESIPPLVSRPDGRRVACVRETVTT